MEGTDWKDAEAPASDEFNGSGTQPGRRPGQCAQPWKISQSAGRKPGSLRASGKNSPQRFSRFTGLSANCLSAPAMADTVLPADENQLFDDLRQLVTKTREELERFKKVALPNLFKFCFLAADDCTAAGGPLASCFPLDLTRDSTPVFSALGRGSCALVALLVVYQLGKRRAGPAASAIAANPGEGAPAAMTARWTGPNCGAGGTGTNPKKSLSIQAAPSINNGADLEGGYESRASGPES